MDAADSFVHAATRAYALRTPCPPAPDDPAWVDRAIQAGVLAPVVHALETADHPVPGSVAGLRAEATARDLLTLADLGVVARALDPAGIPWAVLKGMVLRDVVFEQPNVRDSSDLDLLVQPADIRDVAGRLIAAGATAFPMDWPLALSHRTAEMSLTLPFGTALDLHWHTLSDRRLRESTAVSTADLLARRRPVLVGDVPVPTLDALDFTLHVLVHACAAGCSDLRWLLDAQQLTRWLEVSPDELAERASIERVTAQARVVLECAAAFVDPAVGRWAEAMGRPTPWTRFLARMSRRRPPSAPSVHPGAARHWYQGTRTGRRATAVATARTLGELVTYGIGHRVRPERVETDLADPVVQGWFTMAEAQSR